VNFIHEIMFEINIYIYIYKTFDWFIKKGCTILKRPCTLNATV